MRNVVSAQGCRAILKKSCKGSSFCTCFSRISDRTLVSFTCSRAFHINEKVMEERDIRERCEGEHKGYKWSELMFMWGFTFYISLGLISFQSQNHPLNSDPKAFYYRHQYYFRMKTSKFNAMLLIGNLEIEIYHSYYSVS